MYNGCASCEGLAIYSSWRDLTSHLLMIILFCDSSHAIYSLTHWLYVYIILGSAFLRISGQLAFGVQLDVHGLVWRRPQASRRLRMYLFIFRCFISCVYQQFVRTGCYNCPVLRVVLVMYLSFDSVFWSCHLYYHLIYIIFYRSAVRLCHLFIVLSISVLYFSCTLTV